MYHIAERVNQIIKNQVQTKELVGLRRNVLGVNGAVVFTNLVSQSQYQRTGASRRVIDGSIGHFSMHHNTGNDICNSVRGVVFRILTKILVVVLNQILKNLGEEVVFLLKNFCKAKLHQLINDGTAKGRFLCRFNDILGDWLKELNFFLAAGLDGKDVQVIVCNIHQRIIKKLMERIWGSICFLHAIVVLMVE